MASARAASRRRRTGANGAGELGAVARRAKGPAAAAGAAVGGLAVGAALGARRRARRRPHVLGVPLPRVGEMRSGARQAARAGRRLYELESDVRALREQADTARRQSPIEVVLGALTSRRLPRKT
jgi:fermentation-respiration switch protein FrsA (DUF1100 family)